MFRLILFSHLKELWCATSQGEITLNTQALYTRKASESFSLRTISPEHTCIESISKLLTYLLATSKNIFPFLVSINFTYIRQLHVHDWAIMNAIIMHLYPIMHMHCTLNPYTGKHYRAGGIDVTTQTLGFS